MAIALCAMPTGSYARSAFGPRHSGLEPPGGPRNIGIMPGLSPSRTAEGGMGYKDAYGNTISRQPQEEQKPRQRLSPGAYGAYGKKEAAPTPKFDHDGKPLWKFD